MKYCETCKQWQQTPISAFHPVPGGYCLSDKLNEEYGHAEDTLVYSDSEGGQFWTGPKFGCVNHEEKPT